LEKQRRTSDSLALIGLNENLFSRNWRVINHGTTFFGVPFFGIPAFEFAGHLTVTVVLAVAGISTFACVFPLSGVTDDICVRVAAGFSAIAGVLAVNGVQCAVGIRTVAGVTAFVGVFLTFLLLL